MQSHKHRVHYLPTFLVLYQPPSRISFVQKLKVKSEENFFQGNYFQQNVRESLMNKVLFGFKGEKFIVGMNIKRVVSRHVCVKSESLATFMEIEFKLLLPLIDLAGGRLGRLNQLVCARMDGNRDCFSRFCSGIASLADCVGSSIISPWWPCGPR